MIMKGRLTISPTASSMAEVSHLFRPSSSPGSRWLLQILVKAFVSRPLPYSMLVIKTSNRVRPTLTTMKQK